MKIRGLILVVLTVTIVGVGYQLSMAQSKTNEAADNKTVKIGSEPAVSETVKIGAVNSEKVLQQCKKAVAYQEQLKADQKKTLDDLTALKNSMEAEKEGLKAFKPGSEDYNKHLKLMLSQQAELESQKEYQKQRLEGMDQEWTKVIYTDFVQIVSDIAKEKELIMVVEKRDLEPTMTINEMMVSTRPVIYSGGCLDISSEVLARLNAK
jgi:Skp family chaperone for outer membrane proteins